MATAYFAYGANMEQPRMAGRCPSAVIVNPAVLRDQRFQIGRHGYATVVPEPGAQVHGVLWMLTDADERELDRYEGVAEGLYAKARHRVHVQLGGVSGAIDAVEALVYVAQDAARGRPRPGYLERIIACAERHGLPARYVAELRAWSAGR